MATIKSFTSLEQSKKLTEILPLESADMYWDYDYSIYTCHTWKYEYHPMVMDDKFDDVCIPAWSLAALLELLPKRIEIVDNVYELSVYLYGIYYYNVNNGNLCFESKNKDNFVDACYEAIVFLHEQKLSLYRMNKK